MDTNDHEVCLGLGLGLNDQYTTPKKRDHTQTNNKRVLFLDLSIPLHDHDGGRKEDIDDGNSCSMEFSRKKLRLTRDQTTLLEDSFRQHTTLNTVQKQALAEKLNLKPRQVEVWFQNRRARTKLKQTEVDREFLKKNCERLSEENWRLKKELLELRSSLKMEKPQPPAAATATAALCFNHSMKGAADAREKGRGGGEKQEAAVMEVVPYEP